MAIRSNIDLSRIPPHSEEAEQGVLGCLVMDAAHCYPIVVESLRDPSAAFYDMRNGLLLRHISKLREAGKAVDQITLHQSLKDSGDLETCGGIGYIATLADNVPSTANLPYYLEIIKEKATLRRVISTCTAAVTRAYEHEGEVGPVLDDLESNVLSLRQVGSTGRASVRDHVRDAVAHIEEMHRRQGAIGGIETGLPDLDRAHDGLHGSEFIILAGYPSTGKTALAMNIAEHVACDLQIPVGVFSLEMTSRSLIQRMICARGRVNLRNIRDGFLSERDFPKLTHAAGKIANAPLHVDDSSGLSVFELRAKARRMYQEHGCKVFIVDYLQLLSATGSGRKVENRQQEVSDISKNLKAMGKELDVIVIALSQLNDDGQLRESRSLEQDADSVWIIKKADKEKEEDQESADSREVILEIKKQRNGPAPVAVRLTFLKTITRFESAAKIQDGMI